MTGTRVADRVVGELERIILDGALKPGERLPAERVLAAQLGVSRPSLREALKTLEVRGLVSIRQGGGTYVTRLLDNSFSQPLARLLSKHPENLPDLLEMRQTLESFAAYQAAVRATATDRQNLRERFAALEQVVGEPALDARKDAEFHLAIAEAAHNVVLLHFMRGLFDLLHASIRASLERIYALPGARRAVQEQHAALYEAVMAGDPKAAHQASQGHLDYVRQALDEIAAETQREARARRVQIWRG